jgi:tetratricopeptide (TPR) repeat protein
MSNGRCAKAMRNLGRYYFFENKFKESTECFQKSLHLNKLYPDSWFTMGCAFMKLSDYKSAIFAFGSVVAIDDHKIEAWANIANCYTVTNKHFEAVTCCE